mmetsp:Transcript_96414/g.249328  ORF Transcript_96414/g.249328 Transcript_96414/m.249328 type:complete len:377 (-) Transcript_96414:191-1321(-)
MGLAGLMAWVACASQPLSLAALPPSTCGAVEDSTALLQVAQNVTKATRAAAAHRHGHKALEAAAGRHNASKASQAAAGRQNASKASEAATGRHSAHKASSRDRDLVFFHMPYNFGHTIEKVALMGPHASQISFLFLVPEFMFFPLAYTHLNLEALTSHMVPGGELWGRLVPQLNELSEVTGCSYALTPPKYWPEELARDYFGNKTVFGMLRDPYERLVALFRGNIATYGGTFPEFYSTCDINNAVKQMMRDVLDGHVFDDGCNYVPQAEYFEGPYGVQLPIDNRRFPDSFNEVMQEHGYDSIHVAPEDIRHVSGCNEVWAADLDCEARALVQQVYAEDFKLICEHFGYCNLEENTCLTLIAEMCPADTSETQTSCP